MDARLHHVQGKAERVKLSELLALYQDFYHDRLRLMTDHQLSARGVGQYHFNNTYQYVIAREETHLQWVADAIIRLGGSLPDLRAAADPGPASEHELIETDLGSERTFVDRWQPRVQQVTNARDRKMLEIILGESLEHARLFSDAFAGRTDLLGRSTTDAGERGTVLADRWVE
jgi:bacterioferritin (cytochrome b1)